MNKETKTKISKWAITLCVLCLAMLGTQYGISFYMTQDLDGPCGGICNEDQVVQCLKDDAEGIGYVAICVSPKGGTPYVGYYKGRVTLDQIERLLNEAHMTMEPNKGSSQDEETL